MTNEKYTTCCENSKLKGGDDLTNNPDCNIEDHNDWCAENNSGLKTLD